MALYYAKLIRYAATAEPRIFHILWNNKFEYFDRTLLMLYYRLLGKKIVLTAHNVNACQAGFQRYAPQSAYTAESISAGRPYLRSHGKDETGTHRGIRRAREAGLRSSRSGSTMLFRIRISHQAMQGGGWESGKVKERSCSLATSRLIRVSSTFLRISPDPRPAKTIIG